MKNEFEKNFTDIEDFYLLIETHLHDKSSSKKIEGFGKKPTNIQLNKFLEQYTEQQTFDSVFTNIFRRSITISIFSRYEVEMKKICDQHHLSTNSVFSVKDLKGFSDLEKIKLYLKKQYDINFNDSKYDWNFIDKIRKIRNCLVHEDGICLKSSKTFLMIREMDNQNMDYFEPTYLKLDEACLEDQYEIQPGILLITDLIKRTRNSLVAFNETLLR
jgi:hypothetical protein